MFKIAVCDDEKELCDWMEGVIHHSENGLWQFCSITKFASGEELCKDMEMGTVYHLIFLDIELDTMDGIEVGRYIRGKLNNYGVQIIYISGKTGYAMSLFQNQPFEFLVKPLDEKKVVHLIKRVIEISTSLNQMVQIASAGKYKNVIYCKDILYAFSTVRKVTIHTVNRDYEMYGKLSDFFAQLPKSDFIFIHKSYLVNWLYIHKILKDRVILHDGTELPISRNYRKEVRGAWIRKVEEKHDYT